MNTTARLAVDVNGELEQWLRVNESFSEKDLDSDLVAKFPPEPLIHRVSGLSDRHDFAKHGCDLFRALSQASPIALHRFASVIDFGVGSGRLARMFKGFKGRYIGIDIDHQLVEWVGQNLPWVTPLPSVPRQPLELPDQVADCVISVSVFTHMNEKDSAMYLAELRRVTRDDAYLFLTVHGERALARALCEQRIASMLSIPEDEILSASRAFEATGFHFARQHIGHLTTDAYDYGITFISDKYIHSLWAKHFTVKRVVPGAIHDFQDIVVLRKA